jgi:hypothetical protein
MPITLRRWKEKATKYINAKFKKTGEGSLNYDLKVYLEEPAFQPFLNSSVERINHGADENEEIDKAIKHMARQYLAVIKEAMEEEDGNSSSSSGSSSSSSSSSTRPRRVPYGISLSPRAQPEVLPANILHYADDTMHMGGHGIHHHYYY